MFIDVFHYPVSWTVQCPHHGQLLYSQAPRNFRLDRVPVSAIVSINLCWILLSAFYSGMRYEFLPPYSPDYNPIELAFSALKFHLRRDGEYIRMALTDMPVEEIYSILRQAVYRMPSADVFGWYRHCGYV